MGGGRRDLNDTIDPAVGVWLHRQAGEAVTENDPLIELHLASDTDADALSSRARAAIRIGPAPRRSPLIHEVVGPAGTVPWRGWVSTLPI